MNDVRISGIYTPEERTISVVRDSGYMDVIPMSNHIHIPAGLVSIRGEFRSYNTPDRHLKLYIYPKSVTKTAENMNEITLEGYICKSPVYRKTPKGREITDLLIAVNRDNLSEPSDYIPAIAWGSVAKESKDLPIGSKVLIQGRIQSRVYKETNLAYEVSISSLKIIK